MNASPSIGRVAATFVLASGAGLALAPNADAQIIYSGPINVNIPSTTAGVYINLVTGVSATTPAGAPGWDINPWSAATLRLFANNAASPNDGLVTNFPTGLGAGVDNLPVGTLINGTLTFGRTPTEEGVASPTAFQVNSTNNYIGFRFLNEGTGTLNFGWMQFSTGATLGAQPRSIIGFAYEASGAAINVGDTGSVAVPEPGTYLVGFAAGALALRAWRRRKAA